MATKLRIVLAQINLTVGDIEGNLQKHMKAAATARDVMHADIIVFPELSLSGYPPEDLLLRKSFITACDDALNAFIAEINGIYCFVGHPHENAQHHARMSGFHHNAQHNMCSIIYNGRILATYAKQRLPNYGVFDERRYFKPGEGTCIVHIKNIPVATVICEDLWGEQPIADAKAQGARLILLPNASPFEIDKHERRVAVLSKRTLKYKLPIVYVNQICAQDEIVFDGGSMVMDEVGNVCQFAGFFQENLLPVDITFNESETQIPTTQFKVAEKEENIYQALVCGVREYVNKNNFPSVLIGLSGGIDSALTLTIAVDALGADRVRTIIMPSRFTAPISIEDALAICENLKVQHNIISIEPSYKSFINSLADMFGNKKPDKTEENIQARCRAIILMALSNQTGAMVLSTGNRSELAVGYCTLYGDMAGGFNALKDVPKTMVYALSHYRNQLSPVIPERTISRPPTAELSPNQKDEDTLPPYPIFDKILYAYLNDGLSTAEIVELGFDEQTVKRVVMMIHNNEHKRRQAPPGTRINHKSFIKDWRYPLTSKYRD